MRVDEKVERTIIPAIDSLASHEDEDSTVLVAGLDAVIAHATTRKAEVIARNEARAAALFGDD